MSQAYSSDLRQRIVDAITQGETLWAAAAAFKVSPATAVRLKQRADRTGSGRAIRAGLCQRPRHIGPIPGCYYREGRGATGYSLPDLATWLEEHHGVKVVPSNLSKLLCRAGFAF